MWEKLKKIQMESFMICEGQFQGERTKNDALLEFNSLPNQVGFGCQTTQGLARFQNGNHDMVLYDR